MLSIGSRANGRNLEDKIQRSNPEPRKAIGCPDQTAQVVNSKLPVALRANKIRWCDKQKVQPHGSVAKKHGDDKIIRLEH